MAYPKLIGSSVDPEKLSLTVKGVLVGIVPVAAFLVKAYSGIELDQNLVLEAVDQVAKVVSATMVLLGLVRKIYVYFKK